MKYFNRSLFLGTLALVLGFTASVFAQGQNLVRNVGFVKKERDRLFVTDGKKVTEYFAPNDKYQITNLAILGATTDGNYMLIAGTFHFINPVISQKDSVDAFVSVKAPFNPQSIDLGLGFPVPNPDAKVLKKIDRSLVRRPQQLGVITPDNNEWYGTWSSADINTATLRFYHGKIWPSATDVVDSIPSESLMQVEGDYHMSNLTTSPNGKQMFAIVVDHLQDEAGGNRFSLLNWNPTIVGTPFPTPLEFGAKVGNRRKGVGTDSSMGMFLYVSKSHPTDVEFALMNDNNDLEFYRFPIGATSVSLGSSDHTLPLSILPNDLFWFEGRDIFNSTPILSPNAKIQGNGSDVSFQPGTESIVFLARERNDSLQNLRNKYSSIWTYDMGTNPGKATLVYNDSTNREYYPTFVYMPAPVEEKPGYVTLSATSVVFDAVRLGSDSTINITITNPSAKTVTVDAATVTGAGFTLAGSTKGNTPFSLNASESSVFSIKFTPTVVGPATGALTVKFAGSADSIRVATIIGNGKDTTTGGSGNGAVRVPNAASFTIAASPNPFQVSTKIILTAATAGNASFDVRDILGRVVYSAPVQKLGAGDIRTFEFNAQALGLTGGVYYISAQSGNTILTRQVVFVK